jgi:hypothetical protein
MADRLKHRLSFLALAGMLLALAVPGWAGQVLVYAQNPDYQGLYASQNDTSTIFGAFAQAYDNFSLGTAGTLTQVQWVGGYYNPQTLGPISMFNVGFYANNGGQPGSLITSFAIAGNAGESFLQLDALGDPTYLYTATVNFAASGGTTYWLSVVPSLSFPPQWGWTSSSQGDGISYQDYFGTRSSNPTDLAFALFETQQTGVPEPGSLMLLGTGIIGIAGVIRRKIGA